MLLLTIVKEQDIMLNIGMPKRNLQWLISKYIDQKVFWNILYER